MLRSLFGRRLRLLREIKGFTQAQLAEKIGVTDRYISMIERGISSPSFDVISLLASALDTLPANLFLFTAAGTESALRNGGPDPAPFLDWSRFAALTGTSELETATGRMTWSDAFHALLGYRPGDVVPDNQLFLSHIHPDDRDTDNRNFQRMLNSRQAVQYRLRIHRSDGTLRLVESQIEAQRSPDNTVVKVFRTLTDITDRAALESSLIQTQRRLETIVAERTARLDATIRELEASAAALGESERKYRLLADNSGDVIWAMDLDWRFTYVSPSIFRLRGISPEEAMRESPAETMTPESFARVLQEQERRQSQPSAEMARQSSRLLIEQYHKAGRTVWVEIVVRPQFDESGRMIGYIGVSRDYSERKRMEDHLKDSIARFDLVLKGVDDGIWDWDLESGMVHYSRRCAEMLGYESENLSHAKEIWKTLIHPEDQPAVFQATRDCFDGKADRFALEYRLRHTDGSWRWVLDRGACLTDKNGSVVRMAGTFTDISLRKALEADLARQAKTDGVTGTISAVFFREHGREAVAACKRYGDPLTVFVLDIDHFKAINDTHGHDAGDTVLAALAATCIAALRESDIFCRLGGDEFAALLPHTDAQTGTVCAKRLLLALDALQVPTASATLGVSVCIGLAAFQPGDDSFEDILKRADMALHEAKHAGRSRVAQG